MVHKIIFLLQLPIKNVRPLNHSLTLKWNIANPQLGLVGYNLSFAEKVSGF